VWELIDDGPLALDDARIQVLRRTQRQFNVHAPFTEIDLSSADPSIRNSSIKRIQNSIAHAAALDAGLVVVHPVLRYETGSAGIHRELFQEAILEIRDFAVEHGVAFTIENLLPRTSPPHSTPEGIAALLHDLGSNAWLTFDTGHAHVAGNLQTFLTHLADRILNMHISDNDGSWDQHRAVGRGNIPWTIVRKAIAHMPNLRFLTAEVEEQPFLTFYEVASWR